jgi:hypothetical protein
MRIELAESDESILSVFDAMQHLRPFDDTVSFLRRVRELQQSRYLLAVFLTIVLVAAWGRFAVPGDPSRSGNAPIPFGGGLRSRT